MISKYSANFVQNQWQKGQQVSLLLTWNTINTVFSTLTSGIGLFTVGLVSFYTLWKHQKTSGFLMFLGGIKKRSVAWNGSINYCYVLMVWYFWWNVFLTNMRYISWKLCFKFSFRFWCSQTLKFGISSNCYRAFFI